VPTRCAWANGGPLEIAYHDTEWGVPSRDDRHLFEMLILEGAQAGLSWSTILRKRESYRKAFAGFDPAKVARFDGRKRAALMRDPFVDGEPVVNAWTAMGQVPAETAASRAMSKALVKRGFRFVGPTICYAFMQATGMVNDHITTCFRYSKRRSRRA
jgi:DNA-3-methyladenine glycosylase I